MFIEDVQRWLVNPPKAEVDAVPALPEGFDIERRREVVWRALEEMERRPGGAAERAWSEAHVRWSAEGQLENWLGSFLGPFTRGIGRRISSEATGRGGVDLGDMSYARSVAHEIRNLTLPLATGLGALWEELGQDQPDHERRQKLRQRIDRSLDRLNEFATEAVKLSAAVAEEEILLAEVVAEAVQATESERNGRIAVELREIGTRKIVGTRRDWSTAFINLLRNAAQSRAGKGVVVISTLTDDAGGLHIYVDDDGPGVPEELREQVFEFGHSTRGGSGLGLADARRTAQRSAGTLVCEASPQGGARFHFSLPRRSTA